MEQFDIKITRETGIEGYFYQVRNVQTDLTLFGTDLPKLVQRVLNSQAA